MYFKFTFLLFFGVWQLDFKQTFFDQIIVIKGVTHFGTSLFVVLTELDKLLSLWSLLVKHIWIEERAYIFIISFQTLQDQERRNDEEDLCFPVLKLFSKGFVLLSGSFYHWGEMDQLVALLMVHEIGQALCPRILKFEKNIDKLYVVFQLWIYNLNILLIFFEKISKV